MMHTLKSVMTLLLAAVICVAFFVGRHLNENTTLCDLENELDFSAEWSVLENNGEKRPINLPLSVQDEQIRIIAKLPDIGSKNVLHVKCKYKSMTAWVDGKLVYESKPATYGLVKTDVGHSTADIPLRQEYSGKDIIISIERRDSAYDFGLQNISFTTKGDLGYHVFLDRWLDLAVACCLLLIAAGSFCVWLFYQIRQAEYKSPVLGVFRSLAIFSACFGVWIFSDTRMFSLARGNVTFSGILSYISFYAIPGSLLCIINSIFLEKKRFIQFLLLSFECFFVAELILFVCGIFDLTFMLPFVHIQFIIATAAAGYVIIFSKNDFIFEQRNLIPGTIIAVVLAAASMCLYIDDNSHWMPVACIGVVSLLISIFINGFFSMQDMARESVKSQEYRAYAMTDVLTGLGSRYAFKDFVNSHSKSAARNLTVVVVDINGLKTVNDKFGHASGDKLICAVSMCVSQAFGKFGNCFRMGGDEFMAVLSTDESSLKMHLEDLQACIDLWSDPIIGSASISIGYASRRNYPSASIEKLMEYADQMMYRNKTMYYAERAASDGRYIRKNLEK